MICSQLHGTDRAAEQANRMRRIDAGERRNVRRRQRAHVRPQQTAAFFNRIAGDRHLVFERAIGGLVRLLQALAGAVEFPTVIRAADTVGLRNSVEERCAAMRTRFLNQPKPAAAVFEEDERFAEQAHGLRPAVLHLRGRGDRLPIAPHQRAHRGTRADAGQPFVLFLCQHDASLARRKRLSKGYRPRRRRCGVCDSYEWGWPAWVKVPRARCPRST